MKLGRWFNRNCLSDGELRSLIDNGVNGPPGFDLHLRSCSQCRERMEYVAGNQEFVASRLELLASDDHRPVDLSRAQSRIRSRIGQSVPMSSSIQGESFVSTMWKFRAARGAVAMLALLLLTTAFVATPMRSLADDLFNRFRIEKFEAITVNMEQFTEFGLGIALQAMTADQERLMTAFDGLAEFETTFDKEDPHSNATELGSPGDAQAVFGDFRAPDSLPAGFSETPRILVTEAGSATLTVDTNAANTIINELGLPIYSLPEASKALEMVFEIDVPQALIMHYKAASDGHIAVVQMESPTLTTPDSLDMNALREDILMLPGLPTDLVAQLRSIENWESTLVIPVPEGAVTSDVSIDGEPGLRLEAGEVDGSDWGIEFELEGDASVVMWHDDGNLYVVAGSVSGSDILDVANSLN
ncbi:hypothetical protein BH24CHL1_BH24CHL1_19680 [soil metagenome]